MGLHIASAIKKQSESYDIVAFAKRKNISVYNRINDISVNLLEEWNKYYNGAGKLQFEVALTVLLVNRYEK